MAMAPMVLRPIAMHMVLVAFIGIRAAIGAVLIGTTILPVHAAALAPTGKIHPDHAAAPAQHPIHAIAGAKLES
jgi:hypothetical protein